MNIFIAHQETANFYQNGGLFDASDVDLSKNIGKKCRFIAPSCGVENEIFTIVHLQKNYDGKIIYRGTCASDTRNFGYPIDPNKVEIM